MTDRGRAEADEVEIRAGGHPLEVAVDRAVAHGLYEHFIALGEMIEADKFIPRASEALDRLQEHRQLRLRIRHLLVVHASLRRNLLWNLRVVVVRNPIGRQGNRAINHVGDGLKRLIRHAVDQIEVHAHKAEVSAVVNTRSDHFIRLNAMNMFLDPFVEILHTQRHATESKATQELELLERCHARVDLDRDLDVVSDIERVRQCAVDSFDVSARKVRRRSAAPMDLTYGALSAFQRGDPADLLLKGAQIACGPCVSVLGGLAQDRAIARTELAQRFAKRKVQVERQISGRGPARGIGANRSRFVRLDIAPPRRHGV